MKLNDHFDAAPWLTQEERKLASGLFGKLRRYARGNGVEKSAMLDLELADFILNWLFLQRMRGAVIQQLTAEDSTGKKATTPGIPALLDELAKCRAQFQAEFKAIENFKCVPIPEPAPREETPPAKAAPQAPAAGDTDPGSPSPPAESPDPCPNPPQPLADSGGSRPRQDPPQPSQEDPGAASIAAPPNLLEAGCRNGPTAV